MLTEDDFVPTIWEAMATKDSVHLESRTVHSVMGVPMSVLTPTVSADYVFWNNEGTGAMAVTMEGPLGGGMKYVLSEELGLFVSFNPTTDNQYYIVVSPDWESNPMAALIKPSVAMLDVQNNLWAIDGLMSKFAAVGEPVDVGGVLAQEYVVAVPSLGILPQLGVDGLDALREAYRTLGELYADIEGFETLTDEMYEQLDRKTVIGSLPVTVELHYWISADNLPVKVTYDLGESENELLLTQWGEVDPVVAPSPDQVVGFLD